MSKRDKPDLKIVRGSADTRSVKLSFHAPKVHAARLDSEDLAAFVRASSEVNQATANFRALSVYFQQKYSLIEGNRIAPDGTLIRTVESGGPKQ